MNFATETAHVALPDGTPVGAAIATVKATGYTSRLPQPPVASADAATDEGVEEPEDAEVRSMRQRLAVSAVLTAPSWRWP